MLAKVIDVDDQQIYLEIDRQLRFKSKYVLSSSSSDITRMSRVDFEFVPNSGHSCIVIRSINKPSAELAGH